MTFDLQKILESKREFRRGLALLPIVEKLRLLDALRERQLTLGSGVGHSRGNKGTGHQSAHNAVAAGLGMDTGEVIGETTRDVDQAATALRLE